MQKWFEIKIKTHTPAMMSKLFMTSLYDRCEDKYSLYYTPMNALFL